MKISFAFDDGEFCLSLYLTKTTVLFDSKFIFVKFAYKSNIDQVTERPELEEMLCIGFGICVLPQQ